MPAFLDNALQQAWKARKVMRAENDIEMRKLLGQLFPIALADAAADGDDPLRKRGIGAQGDVLHRRHLTVKPRVRRLANAAGHVDEDIGLFDGFDHKRAETLEHSGDSLGIVLVHLASEGADAKRHIGEGSLHGSLSIGRGKTRDLSLRRDGGALNDLRLYGETDGGTIFTVYHNVGEGWHA